MASEPIRVLHICEAFDPGGVVWWLIDVAKLTPRDEFRHDFFCNGTNPGMRAGEVLELGSDITLFLPTWREVMLGTTLRAVLRSRKYDIVHAHTFNLSGWLLRHARAADVPVRIAHYHNTHDSRPNTWPVAVRRRISRRLVAQNANALLACSSAALANAPRPLRARAVEVIHYGIDLERFSAGENTSDLRGALGLPVDAYLVGHTGRFYPQKNHAALLRIFAELLHDEPRAHLVLMGDGPLRPAMEQLAHDLGIAGHTWFLGARADVPEILRQIDVFAFPSQHEGVGIAVLEARMAGVPVVASDLPAIREVTRQCDGVTLVDCHAHSEFAGAIRDSLQGRRRIDPPESWKHAFSRERSVSELLDTYRQCLDG